MGIEPTYQLVTGTTGLKPGEPTRCPSAPVIGPTIGPSHVSESQSHPPPLSVDTLPEPVKGIRPGRGVESDSKFHKRFRSRVY